MSELSPAAALATGCGLADRSWTGRLEIAGPDRGRFLNGLVTAEVRELAAGSGAYGFVTSRKGGVLADFALLALDEAFWLELPAGRTAAISEHLGKYVLAERVTLTPLEERLALLSLIGPAAAAVLEDLAGSPPPTEPWSHAAVRLADTEVRIANRPLLGQPAWNLWLPQAAAAEVAARFAADPRVTPVGFDDVETARVEAGLPRWGAEIDETTLPKETGLEEHAVSYTKGCYLGQEVVARIHYRGGVNRAIRQVLVEGDELPPVGTALELDGRPVGKLGTVVRSPAHDGRPLGLALLHQRGAEAGTRLEIAGGGEAAVV